VAGRTKLLNRDKNAVAWRQFIADKGPAAREDPVKYLPPFELLKSFLTISNVKGELMVSCSYENLVQMLRRMIAGVEVDESWYLERYPDIADAIEKGLVQSARLHFVNDGFFEGRMPFPIRVDERYYLSQNVGVAEYVRKGMLESGQQHFDENGYAEGRLPFGL
jgi:hypothetical protein